MASQTKPSREPRHARPAASDGTAAPDHAMQLMRLLPLWPHEMADRSVTGRRRILALLHRALRAELSRHAQLLAIYRQETATGGRQTPPAGIKGTRLKD
jgi:hypothetical protein